MNARTQGFPAEHCPDHNITASAGILPVAHTIAISSPGKQHTCIHLELISQKQILSQVPSLPIEFNGTNDHSYLMMLLENAPDLKENVTHQYRQPYFITPWSNSDARCLLDGGQGVILGTLTGLCPHSPIRSKQTVMNFVF